MRTYVDATLLLRHWSGVGWGGILTFMYRAYIRGCYAAATSLVRGWVGWGGILTFMYLAYIRGCYAAATSLVRGWVGWGGILTFMYLAYIRGCLRCCYVTGQGLGGWGGILTFMYLAYIRGCYAAATSLVRGWVGRVGWDINVHVLCVHTWMLRCCYVTGQGLGGVGGILTFMYLAYIRGCYAAATSLVRGWVGWDINVHVPCVHTWMLRCCYVTGQGLGGPGGVGY